MKKYFSRCALTIAIISFASGAQVDVVRKEVRIENQPLRSGGQVESGTIATGAESRLQLRLGESGSLVRAGSRTEAVLRNEKDLALSRGILLTSSGDGGVGRESLNVETRETRQIVKGTMLIAYQPEAYIKVTCIEGKVRVRLKAAFGEFVPLTSGQMLIINPADKRLPEPVEVDLETLIETSVLLGNEFPALPAWERLNEAMERQASAVDGGDLNVTNLLMLGSGTGLTIDRGIEGQRDELAPEPVEEPLPPPEPPERPESGGGGASQPPVIPRDRPFVVDSSTQFDPVRDLVISSSGDIVAASGGVFTFPSGTGTETLVPVGLSLTGNITIPQSANLPVTIYDVYGGMEIGSSQSPTNLTINTDFVAISDQLTITNSVVQAPSNSLEFQVDGLSDGGPAGDIPPRLTVTGSNVSAGTDIIMDARDATPGTGGGEESGEITIDASTVTSSSGSIRLSAAGPAPVITIRNSSQLQALAATSRIDITTTGGRILVSDSTLRAGAEILIDTTDPLREGFVELRNVVANADVIRARAFASGGRDGLLIDGGTYNAASLLRFYSEGDSRLRFRGNVSLNTPDAILAARIVEVDRAGNVSISGRGTVYADDHRYNNGGINGNMNASQGLTRPASGFPGRPAF